MQGDRITIQNLKDAGCEKETIEKFIAFKEKEDRKGQLKLLYSYRKKRLDIVHSDRDKLNCLDYRIYLLQKKRNDV